MKKFYCFINRKNVSTYIFSLAKEARAPTSSSVLHNVLHPSIITLMLATQHETLLRHVFVRQRQNEKRKRENEGEEREREREREERRDEISTLRAWKFACKNGSYTHFVMTYCLTIHRFVQHHILRASFTVERRLIN